MSITEELEDLAICQNVMDAKLLRRAIAEIQQLRKALWNEFLDGFNDLGETRQARWESANAYADALMADFDRYKSSKPLTTDNSTLDEPGYFLVRLEDGVWLTNGEGDPPRTTRPIMASVYGYRSLAEKALASARKYRDFPYAEVQAVQSLSNEGKSHD